MRPFFWYVAFVGLPVVALLGILRLGEGLVAPRAVHGEYTIAVDSSNVSPCLSPLVAGSERRMTIAQSGTRLQLTLGSETPIILAGTLAGDTIRVVAATRCLTADSVGMSATVEKSATETELVGQLQWPGCATCSPAPFRASRLPSESQRGGG